jgi:cytidylate kinase
MKRLIIAIDGPSGAGKGTISRTLAQALGYRHIDTGAMYRAVAWKALRDGIPLDDEASVAALGARAALVVEGGRIEIDGHDVTRAIRTPEIDRAATAVARLPRVREALVRRQHALGESGGVVMEGRDIGTVVFPETPFKFFLDARPDVRVRRRIEQLRAAGREANDAEVEEDLHARDRRDRERAHSPLAWDPSYERVDTSDMSQDEVVDRLLRTVRAAGVESAR